MADNSLMDVEFNDDLAEELSADPETYQDQTSPAPPVTGNYRLKIASLGIRRDKEGNVIMKDNKYPTFVINSVEIVQPASMAGKKIGLLQDITTKPFNRNGKLVSKSADLLRSFDQTRTYRGLTEQRDALNEFFQSGATFQARLDWVANDFEGAKEALENAGITGKYAEMSDEEKQQANAIYKAHKISGMSKFPTNGSGGRTPLWRSPSGNTVEARSSIVRFIPSNEEVRIAD